MGLCFLKSLAKYICAGLLVDVFGHAFKRRCIDFVGGMDQECNMILNPAIYVGFTNPKKKKGERKIEIWWVVLYGEKNASNDICIMQLLRSVKSRHVFMHSVVRDVITFRIK